jgi:hypothetical protein
LCRIDVPIGPTRAREPRWPPSRGCNVPGCGHRRCWSHCETNFGTTTEVSRRTFILLPRRYRNRSARRPHPRGEMTVPLTLVGMFTGFLGLLCLRRQRTLSNDLEAQASDHVESGFRVSCVTPARKPLPHRNRPAPFPRLRETPQQKHPHAPAAQTPARPIL